MEPRHCTMEDRIVTMENRMVRHANAVPWLGAPESDSVPPPAQTPS
jgi:hypothetical protein